MSRTKLSQNSIAAGAINANTMFAADVVSPHAVANTSTYSVAELLVGGTILLDNTGKIGIGTSSPGEALEVYRNAATTHSRVKINNPHANAYSSELSLVTNSRSWLVGAGDDAIGVDNSGDFHIYDATATAYRMVVKSDGKIGIGTTSPEALLNVFTASAGTWTAPTNFNDIVIESNTYAGLVIGVPDADEGLIGISSPSTNAAVGYGMLWDYDVGIGRLFTSKVGASTRIEADNQVANLTLSGASGSEIAVFAGSVSGDTFAAKTNPGIGTDQMYMGFSAPNGLLYSKNSSGAPASNLYLGTTDGSGNTNNVLSLHYDGKVGIGTTSPQGQTHIHLGASSGDLLRLSTTTSGSGASDGIKFHMQSDHGIAYMNMEQGHHSWYTHNGSSVDERMRLTSAGNLGIGTTSPNNILDLESTSPELHINDSDATLGGTINSRVIFQANGSEHGWVGLSSSAGTMGLINNQGDLWISADPNNAVSSTAIKFVVDATEKAYINSQGFGVGAVPNATFGPFLYAQGTPAANKPIIAGYSTGNSNNAGIGILNDSGNRGIWTTGSVMKFTRTYEGNSTADLVIGAAGQVGIAGENYGTDGQVLTSQGASAAPAWEDAGGGGAWTLIGTQTASNSASLTQTGIDATYATYVIILEDMRPATDGTQAYIRLGDSSGIDSTMGDYEFIGSDGTDISGDGTQTTRTFDVDDSDNAIKMSGSGLSVGSGTGEGLACIMYLRNARGSSMYPVVDGRGYAYSTSTVGQEIDFWGARTSMITTDRIQFYFGSGNTTSGRMTVWGIAHAQFHNR